jgi:glycerol-3-phosphate acyltransferase PlsY
LNPVISAAFTVAVFFLSGFLLGSIPIGLILGKLIFKTDIRAQGSGNIGAANALRTLGKGGAVAVLFLDAFKGFILPFFLNPLFSGSLVESTFLPLHIHIPEHLPAAAAALGSVIGHCYSPWLRFRGGKGVATHLGAMFALAWPAGLIFIAVWLLAVVPTRLSSLGSLTASAISVVPLWLFGGPAAGIYALLAAAVIFQRHRENIRRLYRGSERPLFTKD